MKAIDLKDAHINCFSPRSLSREPPGNTIRSDLDAVNAQNPIGVDTYAKVGNLIEYWWKEC
jgi:hypothetical protein